MAIDFPNTPADGQVYGDYYFDESKGVWKSLYRPNIPNVLDEPTIDNSIITNAVITATATTPSTVPITVNGAASQSANLQEWKNSSGIALSQIDSSGSLFTPNVTSTGGGALGLHIKAGAVDHGYISFFPRTATPNTRGGYLGYPSAGSNNFTIANEISGASLVLDSSYVTMSKQPAFRATGVSGNAGQNLSFSSSDSAFNGRNSGWNGTRFTAPVAGVYLFTFSILVGTGSPYARILFSINGSASTTYGDTLINRPGEYTSIGMSMMFRLSVNDYVQLYNEQSNVYGSAFGSFSGYFLG
jgi:hypothetical protein